MSSRRYDERDGKEKKRSGGKLGDGAKEDHRAVHGGGHDSGEEKDGKEEGRFRHDGYEEREVKFTDKKSGGKDRNSETRSGKKYYSPRDEDVSTSKRDSKVHSFRKPNHVDQPKAVHDGWEYDEVNDSGYSGSFAEGKDRSYEDRDGDIGVDYVGGGRDGFHQITSIRKGWW